MDVLRDAVEDDFERILALNDGAVRQTGPLDRPRLDALVGPATHCKVVAAGGDAIAFLIALRESAPYDNDNHRWFVARVPTFFYVDRIVVDARAAGRGIGRRLYADLFATARGEGITTVVCEYNLIPPNPASRAFHERLGFREMGRRWNADRSKCVSMQRANGSPPAGTKPAPVIVANGIGEPGSD